jgi:GR25 family glycosyltransferase involved in LPS biosynthesis
MFKEIPKFVINLDRKQDRLELFDKEMKYIGWEYERFPAIDTNSYIGCALSFMKICEIAKERNYNEIIVLEDDIFFMPYSKKNLKELEEEIFEKTTNWEIFHFGPTIHRPLSKYNDNLLDLTNLPPKDPNRHTSIFGTSGFILREKSYDYFLNWNTNKYTDNSHLHKSIDSFLDLAAYPVLQSFTYKFPVVVQRNYYSDINKTVDKNHYLMTYNWNVYCPDKLPNSHLDQDYCTKLKENEN